MRNNQKTSFAYNELMIEQGRFLCEKRKNHVSMFCYFSISIFC